VSATSKHVFGALIGTALNSSARRRFVAPFIGAVLLGLLPALPSSSAVPVQVATTLSASGSWLTRLNLWRANAALPPLSENPAWSTGDYNHSVYMVKDNLVTHYETPGVPYYTPEGDAAARNGNIQVNSTTTATDDQAIDWWMQAPFHAMGMMDPRLQQTGFGSYRDSTTSPWRFGAALDTIRGNSFTGGSYPVYFPGNGSTEPLTSYGGGEFPDPLQACPGYSVPTGLPVFVEVGGNVSTTAGPIHSFTGNGVPLAHCVIDSTNAALSSYLVARGGVIVIPQQPLQTGVKYAVALTVNGRPYTWSFTVGPFAVTPPLAGWQSLGGGLIGGPDAGAGSPTSEDVFVRGTDNQMWSIHWNGTSFGNFVPHGGVLTADPGAVAQSATKTDAFVRGSDNQLWTMESNSGTFGNWIPLGGGLTSGPDADAWPTHVDVFVRGTDNQLWHKWGDNGTWYFWEPLGGILTSDPGTVSWGPNRADVFVRGSDNQLWHKWYDGITWRPWEPLGGGLSTGPDPASCSSGHLDVFAIGTDGQLWRKGFNGSSWLPWQAVGGIWTSSPSAICRPGTNTIDLFARYTDHALWTGSVSGS
jgi:uncharacterized protein YkwD